MSAIEIITPNTPEDINHVRDLFRLFVQWHRKRHHEDIELIDRYFDSSAFEAELASLPGKYAPPGGELLLARLAGTPVGCVALRQLDAQSGEMKRMFVPPEYHGRGIGKALALEIVSRARSLRYRRILLDTSVRQREAISLYERVGFVQIAPYYSVPDDLRDWLVFMELGL